ncbi:hypothetical protein POM88_043955 [Heracleum sosnowskyi]|uniref:Uncharacterized protein n=1 Tax=Heracleum sosnowskyi TaxID=360622 RepID=A0AAD8H2W6_9APIA|nr:hypothetical protein POM88_043955 [Heracleum sosnowskyi]
MRLNIEESGAPAKRNQHHAFFLRGNSLGLQLCDYSICLSWESSVKPEVNPQRNEEYINSIYRLQPAEGWKEHNCIPDEHYVQTLLVQEGLEGEITRRGVTHTSWDIKSSKIREQQGWHPVTYKLADATPSLIQSIKDIDNINYETEYRREWCTNKGKPAPCFLFARTACSSATTQYVCLGSRQSSQK